MKKFDLSALNENGPKGVRARRKFIILVFAALAVLVLAVLILTVSLISVSLKYSKDEDYIAVAATRVYDYYTPDDMIELDDYSFGRIWIKALRNVPKSNVDLSRLSINGDYRYYSEDGQIVSKLGVDVSYFQQDINWKLVKQSGIDFALIRAGYRGYESGSLNKDNRFDEYIKGASAAGLETGVYFYSQAISVEEAVEEAEFTLEQLKGYRITYPVIFDWEITGEAGARTNDVSPATLTECAAAFCNRIAEEGYIPMIYSSKRQAIFKMDRDSLSGYDFWLAEYNDQPEYPYLFQIWQYTSEASIPGIPGNVDMNISFVDYTQERAVKPDT